MQPQQNYRTCDIMVCAMARLLKENETAFHGVSSHMPMISILLAKAMHAPNLVHLNIPGGVNPRLRGLKSNTSAGAELLTNATAVFPLQEVFDLSMRGQLDVAFLSGIQFDDKGRVNASVIGDYHKPKVRMPGGAGSAVLIPTARRAILWRTKHDKRTFVQNVEFVTTQGNIDCIVTPLCVFRFQNGHLLVDSIHPGVTWEELQANTGFPLVGENMKETPAPTREEMMALKRIDPTDLRNIEFL